MGMYGVPGWKWREREGREEKRSTRNVVRIEKGKDGAEKKKQQCEEIPLPDEFRLGLAASASNNYCQKSNHQRWASATFF